MLFLELVRNLTKLTLAILSLVISSFYKYLGIYLDQSLSFKEHTAKLVKKVSSQLSMLGRIRNSVYVIKCLRYDTVFMILPKLDYCDFVWINNAAASTCDTLERFQTRTARIILKENKS